MTRHFATDARLLEDVHRLQEQRVGNAEIASKLFDFRRSRKAVKDWIEIVQRVADLVNRPLFTLPQCSVRQECILLKEEADLVTRFQEIVIASAVLFVCGEDRNDAPRIKVTNKFFRASAQTI